jgi:hypothetical protein
MVELGHLPRVLVGERQLPVNYFKPSFIIDNAPQQVRQLAASNTLSDSKEPQAQLLTVAYNSSAVHGHSSIKLDLSRLHNVHTSDRVYLALYTDSSNFLTQLSCVKANVEINPDVLTSSQCIVPAGLENVEVNVEQRLPNQFFYLGLLVQSEDTDVLFLIKFVIINIQKSRFGEALLKLLLHHSYEVTQQGSNCLSQFIDTVITQPSDITTILSKYLGVSSKRVLATSVCPSLYAEFKESRGLTMEDEALSSFAKDLKQWFSSH